MTSMDGSGWLPLPPLTNGRHSLFYMVVHAVWGHLSLGSPEPDFLIWFPSPFNRSLYVGRKCSVAGCILQENKSKGFCAPGIRQKARNDNFSVMQSDYLKTFQVIFSISLREDIFSTVWTKTVKQRPWNHLLFLCFLASPLTLSQTRITKSECDGSRCLLDVKPLCWILEVPICCWANIKTARGESDNFMLCGPWLDGPSYNYIYFSCPGMLGQL